MRFRIVSLAAIVAALAVASCATKPTEDFTAQDQQQIRELIKSFVAAYNAKDLAKVGDHFSGNAVLMPANRSTLRGVDMVKVYYDERFKGGVTGLTIEPQDLGGHGPLGYLTATFSLRIVPPDGSAESHDRGKVLFIVRRYQSAGWKFEYQIMSSDLPPAPPPAPPAEAEKTPKK